MNQASLAAELATKSEASCRGRDTHQLGAIPARQSCLGGVLVRAERKGDSPYIFKRNGSQVLVERARQAAGVSPRRQTAQPRPQGTEGSGQAG